MTMMTSIATEERGVTENLLRSLGFAVWTQEQVGTIKAQAENAAPRPNWAFSHKDDLDTFASRTGAMALLLCGVFFVACAVHWVFGLHWTWNIPLFFLCATTISGAVSLGACNLPQRGKSEWIPKTPHKTDNTWFPQALIPVEFLDLMDQVREKISESTFDLHILAQDGRALGDYVLFCTREIGTPFVAIGVIRNGRLVHPS